MGKLVRVEIIDGKPPRGKHYEMRGQEGVMEVCGDRAEDDHCLRVTRFGGRSMSCGQVTTGAPCLCRPHVIVE